MTEIKGILPVVITPSDAKQGVDVEALRKLIDFLVRKGVHGIICLGSTGEFAYLSDEERKKVIDVTIDEVNGRVSVIAGTSAVRTAEAVTLAKYAKNAGADAVMAVPSFYYKLSEKEVYGYYKAIADVGLAIIAYNNPWTTKIDLQPQFLVKLANEVELVDYVKESSGAAQRVHEIIRLDKNKKITVLCGTDDLAFESFAVGAKGWVAGVANIIPEQCVELYKLSVEEKKFDKALKLYYKLLPLLSLLENSGKYAQFVKAGVEMIGFKAGSPRSPLVPIEEKEREMLKNAVKSAE